MDANRIERLTQQQRVCLRHVYAHMTSKEIALLLGIRPGSVDQHLKSAMQILGVAERRAAARLLVEHERESSQRLAYQFRPIASEAGSGRLAPSNDERVRQGLPTGEKVEELQAGFDAFHVQGLTTSPLPSGGAEPHGLKLGSRLAWLIAGMIALIAGFGALVAAAAALGPLLRG
ncbi:MAG TPA: helix-turn-helix transcriptional regulator [Allosphingosinicella sp.]|jgi:DNA-binding CsgD family transcriptional regulator